MQTAKVVWVQEQQFLATMPSGHAIPIDADRTHNSAPGPMELLLAALGACTATDVVMILAEGGVIAVMARSAGSGFQSSSMRSVP